MNYCQTTILHLQSEMAGLRHELPNHPSPAYPRNLLHVMAHARQQWEAELAWARELSAEELGGAPPGRTHTRQGAANHGNDPLP